MYFIERHNIERNKILYFIKEKKDNKDKIITFKKFLTLIKDKKFVDILVKELLNNKFNSYYFESVPIKKMNNIFYFVLVKAYFRNMNANFADYGEYFYRCSNRKPILVFPNLTKKVLLIVPCPLKTEKYKNFLHIKQFFKYASKEMIYSFFKTLSIESKKFLEKKGIIYLKTHGHGVPYFHFRLQYTPQYYEDLNLLNKYYPLLNRKHS